MVAALVNSSYKQQQRLEFLNSAHYKVENACRRSLVLSSVSSMKSFLVVAETFPLVSSGYSGLWQYFVSILLILLKKTMGEREDFEFGVGVTRSHFHG